jgi:hypothetical protein
MPHLGIELNRQFSSARFGQLPGGSGRTIRRVNAAIGVNAPGWPSRLSNPVFRALLLRLAIIAAFALSVAIWRLYYFAR